MSTEAIPGAPTLKARVVSWLVFNLYRLWYSTWRIELYETESMKKLKLEGKPFIMAMWHGDELAGTTFGRFYKSCTMASTSKDGELMNGVLNRMGVKTSRGSSTRGGATALKGIIRLVRAGYSPVIPVDGPRGPYHKAKPGVFEVARVCRVPIFPCALACDRKIIFEKSWNKAFMPLPFARVCLVWGEEFNVPEGVDSRDQALARALEESLDAVSRTAAKLFAKI